MNKNRQPMRIAFVTPEFETEYENGGGLGSYLARICEAVLDRGDVPEVFVTSRASERLTHKGVLVHRVDTSAWQRRAEVLKSVGRFLPRGSHAIHCSAGILADSLVLAAAFHRRERETEFRFVQSADFRASGLFVKRSNKRPHVVRCSCAADLWGQVDGSIGFNAWHCYWERMAIAKSDLAYAPSSLVANHYREKYGLDVGVVRPPIAGKPDADEFIVSEAGIGKRFHLHFGQLRKRKGTEFLAEALPLVWERCPDYQLVLAGGISEEYLENLGSKWGKFRNKVHYVGKLPKRRLFGLLAKCEATVLPSLVDNLPNTVIESLQYDKPVIGTYGSSVDEIVADGKNGVLVPFGDHHALAAAIALQWEKPALTDNLMALSPLSEAMDPTTSVNNLIQLIESRGVVKPAS